MASCGAFWFTTAGVSPGRHLPVGYESNHSDAGCWTTNPETVGSLPMILNSQPWTMRSYRDDSLTVFSKIELDRRYSPSPNSNFGIVMLAVLRSPRDSVNGTAWPIAFQ